MLVNVLRRRATADFTVCSAILARPSFFNLKATRHCFLIQVVFGSSSSFQSAFAKKWLMCNKLCGFTAVTLWGVTSWTADKAFSMCWSIMDASSDGRTSPPFFSCTAWLAQKLGKVPILLQRPVHKDTANASFTGLPLIRLAISLISWQMSSTDQTMFFQTAVRIKG